MSILLPSNISAESAAKLKIKKIASEVIALFELIKLDSNTHASKADITSYTNAKVIGIAIESAIIGQEFEIQLFGVVEDPSFLFTLGEPLFLQSLSGIGETAPSASGQFITNVGQSLGAGGIFIDIIDPVEII